MSAPSAEGGVGDGADAAADALADALIAGRTPTPALDDAARLALAWHLKARCYAAWSSAPEATHAIAQALRRLELPHGPPAIAALADWTAGIAAIVRADMDSALGALERAAARWRALGEVAVAAQATVPQIVVLSMLGRFDDAVARGESTRAALEAAGDALGAARVSLNLGSLAVVRDCYAESLPHYRAAAALFARAGDREHSVMADLGLANALNHLGEFDEAALILDRAGARARRHGLTVLDAMARLHRAHLDLTRGDFARALAGLETCRRDFERLGLPGVRLEAEKNLADAYLDLNLLPEAEALFARLDHELGSAGMPTRPWVALQWARVAALGARHDEALARLDRAADAFAAQGNDVGAAQVALLRAQIHLALGDAAHAERGAGAAADAFARVGVAHLEAAARVTQADALLAAGDAAAAATLCERVIADAGPQTRVRALAVQGHALHALGQPQRACAVLDATIDAFEALRSRVPGDEMRRAFVNDVMRPYRLRLAMALDDATRDPSCVERAFDWLERFKARALAERSAGAPAEPGDERSAALRMRLDWIHRRQQALLEEDGSAPASLRAQALHIEHELLETRRRAVVLAPQAEPAAASVARSPRETLGVGEAIVEYGVVGDELFAFVVDRGVTTLHRRLASWREVVPAVQGLRFQIETLRHGQDVLAARRETLRARARGRLARVHELVWRPLEARLQACHGVIVVPHGILHGLPFAALDDGRGALIDRHAIGLAPNAASLTHGAPPRRDGTVLVLGDTRRLAHAQAEIDAASAAWPGAIVLDADQVDGDSLERQASRVSLMHLACHASFRPDNPRFAWLQIGNSRVLACDIERWRMPAATVVLSGCETAVSDPDAGDEALGLVRAFQLAGAARVVGSLWPVDDGATAWLMSVFHAGLAAGRGAAAALNAAQREVRASHDDPYGWAGFMVHGGL